MTDTARPEFIRAEIVEDITLADPRPHWQGVEPASITLGRYGDGRWAAAVSASIADNYTGQPLGHWSDARSFMAFDSREAALESGARRILEWLARVPDPCPAADRHRIMAWARGLLTFQGDLFAVAA